MAGFKITDDELSGQEIYGNKDKVDKAWSVKFDHLTYDKFKFQSLDESSAQEFEKGEISGNKNKNKYK